LDPNLFEAAYFYARACVFQGELEQAAKLWERALEIRPGDCSSLAKLFMVYRSLGREQDMRVAARRAIEGAERELHLHPESARPAYLGAIMLAKLGERERALEWASRAMAIDPNDSLTHYNIACMYSIVGATEEAIDLLDRTCSGVAGSQAWYVSEWMKHD